MARPRTEEFLTGQRREVGDVRLPRVGTDVRLRWDLPQLHAAVDAQRRQRNLTWVALAAQLGCTPSRLTNLRTARLADMDLTMRLTQWLGRPAAGFCTPPPGDDRRSQGSRARRLVTIGRSQGPRDRIC